MATGRNAPTRQELQQTAQARARKKVKKNVSEGIAHIHASFNNTIVTITDRHGKTTRRQVPPVPQGGREALPQGREMLYRQVCRRAARLCSGPARPEERRAAFRLRQATARKTEDAPYLRRAGAPVPQHLCSGCA